MAQVLAAQRRRVGGFILDWRRQDAKPSRSARPRRERKGSARNRLEGVPTSVVANLGSVAKV